MNSCPRRRALAPIEAVWRPGARFPAYLSPNIYLQCAIENTEDPLGKGAERRRRCPGKRDRGLAGDHEKETYLRERLSFFGPLSTEDLVSVRSGGGGGWGSPGRLRETRNRWLAMCATNCPDRGAGVASVYHVAVTKVDKVWTVDQTATVRLRAEVGV